MDYTEENSNLDKTAREMHALESDERGLSTHRFRLAESAKDRDFIRTLREFMQSSEAKKTPEFIGIGFFGSRIKGYANVDSDWDITLLFKGAGYFQTKSEDAVKEKLFELAKESGQTLAEPSLMRYTNKLATEQLTFIVRVIINQDISLAPSVENYITGFSSLFFPYIGNIKELKNIRKDFFGNLDRIDKLCAEKIWGFVSARLFEYENSRTLRKYVKMQDHPRWNLYPHSLEKAKTYYLGAEQT